MKRFWLTSLLFLFLFFFYFLLIPVKIYKKDIYHVDKYFSINDMTNSLEKCDGYFFSDDQCGYFLLDHGMIYHKKVSNKQFIQANRFFYLIYKKVGDSIEIFSPTGEKISDIYSVGYPYVSGDFHFFYIIKTNGMGFSLCTMKGEYLIDEINFTSMISSISTDKYINTLVSTIDGKTYLYSMKGERLFQTKFDDSKIIISKSNTIDYEGNNIAICSGINPEYIEIYGRETGTRIAQLKTDTNYRYETFLRFINNRIYYEGLEEIKFYDFVKKKHGNIKIKGMINEITFDSDKNMLVATSLNDMYYLTIFSLDGEKKYYKEFTAPISNFKFIDKNMFYFKFGDKILKMVLGRSA